MSEALVTSSIVAPGFYGLNTQESSIELNNGYALQAFNVVIDKSGTVISSNCDVSHNQKLEIIFKEDRLNVLVDKKDKLKQSELI
jgi:hypothetical protein